MTRKEIEEFATGYIYPTQYIEHLLRKYDYNTEIVNFILVYHIPEDAIDALMKDGNQRMIIGIDLANGKDFTGIIKS